jgi:hypothetical protein
LVERRIFSGDGFRMEGSPQIDVADDRSLRDTSDCSSFPSSISFPENPSSETSSSNSVTSFPKSDERAEVVSDVVSASSAMAVVTSVGPEDSVIEGEVSADDLLALTDGDGISTGVFVSVAKLESVVTSMNSSVNGVSNELSSGGGARRRPRLDSTAIREEMRRSAKERGLGADD